MKTSLSLLDTIIEVAALEGFNWSMSPDDIVDWLEDVRKENNLYAIVFVWDEFTEYFRNNQNNITGLQEIAQASSRISCYLFLITHSSAGQLIQDRGSKTIIEARFKLDTIELEESTAFKLLGQALHHEPDLADEWKLTCDELWSGVKRGSVDLIKNKDFNIQDEDFRTLLPMHPYAAYLLKFIAKDISSNQRTIFQFLSGDYSGDENKTNFKWFIDNFAYDYGKWNYLTVDYLWDYFFKATNVDLDEAFIQTISHYNNFASLCDDPNNTQLGERRRRVLKATLLLAALQIKNGAEARTGATSLLRPTLANIKACFAGTPQETTAEQDLNYFASKGIIGRIESSKEVLFVMASASIDTERMKQIIEETKKNITFEKLVADSNYKISDKFMPDGYLKWRMKVVNVTPVNAVVAAGKVEKTENQIPTFFVFAKNEAEQGRVKEAVAAIFDKIGNRCIVVDFSALPFTDVQFSKFIESKAKEAYFSKISNQKPQLNLAKKNSEEVLDEWKRKLYTTSLYVYSAPSECIQKTGGSNLRKAFKEINAKFYGCGLEEIAQNDKLFAETGFKETVAQMAMEKINVPANYSYVKYISQKLKNDNLWNTPKYWEAYPAHPVSKMKIVINDIVEQGFKKSTMVSISDIWEELKKPPFGLLPNTGSVFLLGFLLAEYADSTYYKRDMNNNTVSLNYIDLSEIIFGVVKGLKKAEGQFIVQQTPEQMEFCRITGEIFNIAKDKRNSVDDIAKNVNIYLINNKYPMWAMRYYIEEELCDHEYKDVLVELTTLFCEFIKPETKDDRNRSNVVNDIYKRYQKYNAIDEVYRDNLSIENMRSGMDYYIGRYKPELIVLAGGLEINAKEYLELLNQKLSNDSSYLWELGDTNRQIDNLYIDLKLINDINRVLTTRQKTYSDARKALIEKLKMVKIPNALLKELKPGLNKIIECFYLIKENVQFDKEETASVIANFANDFVEFFNNQYEVFCGAVEKALKTSVPTGDLEYLFNRVPSETLFGPTDRFTTAMQHELNTFHKSEKTRTMFDAWRKATNSTDPAEWSQNNGIPILCLFTEDIINAQKIFAALNKTSNLPAEKDIDDAIEFLQSGRLDVLNNKEECVEKFIAFFAGEYAYVISSADELKDQIRCVAGSRVYDWYDKANSCRGKVREFAMKCYKLKFRSQAKERIRKLTAEQAQKYLYDLIENDPLLGINILKG